MCSSCYASDERPVSGHRRNGCANYAMIPAMYRSTRREQKSRTRRLASAAAAFATSALLAVETAQAFQCPILIRKINAEAGNRFDDAAYDAVDKAALAARLHGEGQHPDAEKIALQGLLLLGVPRPRSQSDR